MLLQTKTGSPNQTRSFLGDSLALTRGLIEREIESEKDEVEA